MEMKNEERRTKKNGRTKGTDACSALLSFRFKGYILLSVYQNLSIH